MTGRLQDPADESAALLSAESKANILLADDNPTKRFAMKEALSGLGHNLFEAESGQEVLRLILERDYAVVLLDVQMPDMDGFEIARLIRERRQSRHTPIIFITAYHSADVDVRRGYSLGAVDYIFAPVISEILRAKVSVFIELALMRQRLETLNAALNDRARELEGANKELESFTYSVSHDLRAPLRAVNGFARMLEEDCAHRLDAEGRRLLKAVLDGGQRMGQLIEDLLAFSRYSRKPVAKVEFDMTKLARTVFEELVSLNADRVPELRLSELPPAFGDSTLLRQVWINLLSNAIKYTNRRPHALVEVSGRAEGAQHVYCVQDNGAGFDMRYYDRLFGIFQRLHSADEYPGTGVGLAIVERVVSRHGGRVWGEGKTGEGATFFFSLPAPRRAA